MELVHELLEEKRKYEISKLAGVSYDLSHLREVSMELKKLAPKTFPINVEGSDIELIKSISAIQKQL